MNEHEKETISVLARAFIDQLRDINEVRRVVVLVVSEDDDIFEVGFGCLACCAEIAMQFSEDHMNETHEGEKEIRH